MRNNANDKNAFMDNLFGWTDYLYKTPEGLLSYDVTKYVYFYENNLYSYLQMNGSKGNPIRIYDSITADSFFQDIEKKADAQKGGASMKIIQNVVRAEITKATKKYKNGKHGNEIRPLSFPIFQRRFEDELGIRVCMMNMYTLAWFIVEMNKSRLFALLNPTAKDCEGKLSHISISFDKDKTVDIKSKYFLDVVRNALKVESEKKGVTYEINKIVTLDKIASKREMSALFVNEILAFFGSFEFLPNGKRLNLTKQVPTVIQDLVLYLLKLFGFYDDVSTVFDTFRQLKSLGKKININPPLLKTKDNDYIALTFIPYDKWVQKDLKKTQWNIEPLILKPGDRIIFPDRMDVTYI